ncbi:unnamed protein product [Pseudo-nitzschia multistriata]|uniref:Uncharacterized protein n=1 Tax=Pseudo-nitzschia multistriata TaxID=183589 RepID=A0A448YXG9_9STRA|nr:unnamed protein product [Pseudo-nitzschia multistriata]
MKPSSLVSFLFVLAVLSPLCSGETDRVAPPRSRTPATRNQRRTKGKHPKKDPWIDTKPWIPWPAPPHNPTAALAAQKSILLVVAFPLEERASFRRQKVETSLSRAVSRVPYTTTIGRASAGTFLGVSVSASDPLDCSETPGFGGEGAPELPCGSTKVVCSTLEVSLEVPSSSSRGRRRHKRKANKAVRKGARAVRAAVKDGTLDRLLLGARGGGTFPGGLAIVLARKKQGDGDEPPRRACEDDASFRYGGDPARGCWWVGEAKTAKRCRTAVGDHRRVRFYCPSFCKASCNTPTGAPTLARSAAPSAGTSAGSTVVPSAAPSAGSTVVPTANPSAASTVVPTAVPTASSYPSSAPSQS